MKKLIFTFFTLALTLTTFAQDIKFGIKGGASFTNQNGQINLGIVNLDIDGDFVPNYHAGAMLHIGISDKFAIQPELLLSSQGTELKNNVVLSTIGDIANTNISDVQLNVQYLSVPVWLKVYPVEGFSLMAGPQLNFRLNSEEKLGAAGLSTSIDALNNTYNDVDFGLGFGAQYEFDFGLTLGASYNLGLTDAIDVGFIRNVRNQSIQLSAGWFIL